MSRRVLASLGGLLGAVVLLAGCTGVPTSSPPQVVRSVADGGEAAPEQLVTPAPGSTPQTLVQNFLNVNSSSAGKHASARTFLTAAARSRWTDTTVTVVSSLSVGAYTQGKPIVVNAAALGTLSADGTYTPTLQTDNAAMVQFQFGVGTENGEYRISSLRSGLILTESQFKDSFVPRSVYFFDLAHRYLVPDARWVPDSDPVQASELLMNQLAGGPSAGLQNAVSTDTLPAQASTRHIDVTGGDPVRIEISGASQLDATSKDRLAAQIASTLSDVDRGRSLQITDGGARVTIPDAGGTQFTPSDFGDTTVAPPIGEVYYVRGGQIVDEQRRVVRGPLNYGRYPLVSVAVSRSGPGGNLTVAGVTDSDGVGRLVMGSQSGGLHLSDIVGATSRPAFAPGRAEAWVGVGAAVYRNVLSGNKVSSAPVELPPTVVGQRVIALRLSPEGSRIGLVLRDSAGRQQLYTGAVVRTATQVRVDTLQQISPDDVTVTDLAWIDDQRLYAIGFDQPSQDAHVYQTGADGSVWSEDGIGLLPGPPSTLTVALGERAWVSVGSNVYVQDTGTTWSYPGSQAVPAIGTAPAYVE